MRMNITFTYFHSKMQKINELAQRALLSTFAEYEK